MPIPAEFSERQYELAINTELLAGSGQFSVPSQAAEHDLGYDVALVPGISAVWSMLGLDGGPPGAAPGRGVLGHPAAPVFAASLFLQYKRPEKLLAANAREARLRSAAGADPCLPYLRYQLEANQQSRLIDLSREVGPLAEVCYAAATFVSLAVLTECQASQMVVSTSNFLSVAALDAVLKGSTPRTDQAKAHVWTYGESRKHVGVLCSDPMRINSYGKREILDALAGRLAESPIDLAQHLYALDESMRAWEVGQSPQGHGGEPSYPSRDSWPMVIQMPGAAGAALSIQDAASRQGLGWYLAFHIRGTPGP